MPTRKSPLKKRAHREKGERGERGLDSSEREESPDFRQAPVASDPAPRPRPPPEKEERKQRGDYLRLIQT